MSSAQEVVPKMNTVLGNEVLLPHLRAGHRIGHNAPH